MSSIQTSTNLPALAEPHERDAIAHVLEAVLHEVVDLSLIAKQLQWAVVGPRSFTLRTQLNELASDWRELADVVAQRTLALGRVPSTGPRAVVDGSTLSPVPAGPVADHSVVRELTHRVSQVAEGARERMVRIAEMDAVSQAVLGEVVLALEMQQSMLRTQLSGPDDR